MKRDTSRFWIHRLPWIARIDSKLLLVFLIIAPTLLAFLKISSEVAEGDTMAFDRLLLQELRSAADPGVPAGPAWLHKAMVDFTALGGGPVLTLITVLAAGYLLARRKAWLALALTALTAAGGLLNSVLKYSFVRPRPDIVPHLVDVSSASFPSAHALNSAMVYLTLGVLLASAEPSWRVRIFLMSAAILLTLVVGISRVYLGVHWPTDVLAGWSVGALWALLSSFIARWLARRRANTSDVSVTG